ncbi:MAG: ABC transporter ATP-binding protein [Acidobacteria bacterium]|nr:ABC transporter ATP-binding protein [Acidobacteriota bacterium]
MAGIRLEHISKIFSGKIEALHDISLEIHDREIVTVVGPSGCGKSSLLRIIAGLDEPSGGSILIDGQSVRSVPARRRNLAMVFQSYALYPHMTCYENIALNLRLKGVPASDLDRSVRETAALLDIGNLLGKKPRELSGGQRQRVAVGRAIVRKPRAFLFDEPLSNLDALLRERVRHELKSLFRLIDATVVYVTHDQIEAMSLADRVVVLNNGRIQQIGSPDEVYRRPVNRFVASFIGSPSMNTFEAEISDGSFRLGPDTVNTGLRWSGRAWVGIRPETVRLSDSGIPAEVVWLENLGSQCLVGLRAGGILLTMITADRPASNRVRIRLDAGEIHVFDQHNGENLILGMPGRPARP